MATITVTPELTDRDIVDFIRRAIRAGERVQITATEPFMTPQEFADSMDVSRAFIMNKIVAGDLQTIRRGNRHRISEVEAERFRSSYFSDMASIQD
ncbi:MAG: hypothetical protein LBB58_06105 [Cellulomonadaceae bacterium]|jgi:hypothetical protein|nr:hypothetical protein [Cellulomonadaceae bacterium]